MSRPKGFNDFSYGVGLEYNASSYKQVKDQLKGNLDNLKQLADAYNKMIKVDPTTDLSKVIEEFKEVKLFIDQIKSSGNPFSEFVDKGVLNRIATLEQNMQSLTSISSELKNTLSSAFGDIKATGLEKFSGSFDKIFSNKAAEITDISNKIQNLSKELEKLEDLNFLPSAKFETKDIKVNKATVSELKQWISEFKKVYEEYGNINLDDTTNLSAKAEQLREIGTKISQALQLPNIQKSKNFSSLKTEFNGMKTDFEYLITDLLGEIEKQTSEIQAKKAQLEQQLVDLQKVQQQHLKQQRASRSTSSAKLDKMQVDQPVKITPNVVPSEWAKIINSKLKAVEDQLDKVHLTPTFAKSSKNLKKEMQGNLAAINHSVKVDLKVEDNLKNFEEKIKNIDISLANAKEQIAKNAKFTIGFEWADGQRFKDVAYPVINQFKNIPVTLKLTNGKSFMSAIANLRKGVDEKLQNIGSTLDEEKITKKLNDIPITLKVGNKDALLTEIDQIRSAIDAKIQNIGVNLQIANMPQFMLQNKLLADGIGNFYNGQQVFGNNKAVDNNTQQVNELSEAAQKAQAEVIKIKQAIQDLNDNGIKSNTFSALGILAPDGKRKKGQKQELTKMLQEYYDLEKKLSDQSKFAAIYKTSKGMDFDAYNRDVDRKVKLENDLNLILQSQLAYSDQQLTLAEQRFEAESKIKNVQSQDKNQKIAASADDANKKYQELNATVEQTRNIINDLNKNGSKSSYFVKLGAWDSKNNSFKKNKEDIAQLITKYKELHELNKKNGTKDKNNPQLKEEYKLRGQISAILRQQKQHVAEILESKEKELASVKNVLDTYKQIPSDGVKIDTAEAKKKIENLNNSLKQTKDVLKSLKTEKFDSQWFGFFDKKGNTLSGEEKNKVSQLVAEYKNLLPVNTQIEKILQNQIAYSSKRIQDLEKELTLNKSIAQTGQSASNETINKYKQIEAVYDELARKVKAYGKKHGTAPATILPYTQEKQNEALAQIKSIAPQLDMKSLMGDSWLLPSLNDIANALGVVGNSASKTSPKVEELQKKLSSAKEALASLQKDGTKSEWFGKIGNIDSEGKRQQQSLSEIIAKSEQLKGTEAQLEQIRKNQVKYLNEQKTALEGQIAAVKQTTSAPKQKTETKKQAELEKDAAKKLNDAFGTEHVEAMKKAVASEEEKRKKSVELTKQLSQELAVLKELNKLGATKKQSSGSTKNVDTSAASERIAKNYSQLEQAALNFVQANEKAVVGMKPLGDGVVEVSGVIKDSSNAWKSYTMQVKASGKVDNYRVGSNQSVIKSYLEREKAAANAAKAEAKQKKSMSFSKAESQIKAIEALSRRITEYQNIGGLTWKDGNFGRYFDNLKNIKTELQSMLLVKPENQDDAYKARLDNLVQRARDAASKIQTELNKSISGDNLASVGALNEAFKDLQITGQSPVERFVQMSQAVQDYANTVENSKVKIIGFDAEHNKLNFSITSADGTVRQFIMSLNDLTGAAQVQEKNVKNVGNAWMQFKASIPKTLGSIFRAAIGGTGIYKFVSIIRTGITSVKDLDAAMTELKKVTDETDATYEKFVHTASQSASRIGSTLKEFVNATADFARLGYNIEDASNLAEVASIYTNIGDDVDSIDDATASIISTMQAFGIEAGNAIDIVNKFNEVGNNFAISSGGIGDALQNSASALHEAGNTIDESVALITAANSVVQNPNSVGTALKTLSLRLRGAKVDLEDAGLETEGMADSVATLRQKLLALTGQKVDIMFDDNTFKNSTQILREMSAIWEQMTDINQSAALELMGGKRQANILSAIISNFDMVEDIIETSLNSENSALKENEKYMQSIQGRIDKFNNAKETMWAKFIDDDVIKKFVDFGTTVIEFLDKIGIGWTALLGLFGGSIVASLFKGMNVWFQDTTGNITLINSLTNSFGNLKNGIIGAASALKGFVVAHPAITAIVVAITAASIILPKVVKSTKEIQESAKEAVDSYNLLQNELKSAKKTINDIGSDYKQLSFGVDELGNNVSLTTSEYERYNDIVNQIADMFPEMVKGYTSEGNAIIKNKGNVEALTEAYKALKNEANNSIIAKAADIMTTYKYTTEGGFWQWDTTTPDSIAAAKELEKILREQDTYNFKIFGQEGRTKYHDAIIGLLEDAGISKESWNETNEEYVKRAVSKFPGIVQSIINTWESTVNTAISNVKPLVQAYLETSVGYAGLNEEQKAIIDSVASVFDEEFFNKFDGDASKLQQGIENLILKIRSSGIDDEYSLVLNARTELNNNQVSLGDYKNTINSFTSELERLQKDGLLNEDDAKYIKMSIGIDTDDGLNIDALIAHTQKLFNKKNPQLKQLQEKVLTLNLSDLKIIDGDTFDVQTGTLDSWEQLIKAIEDAKIAATQDFTHANFSDYASDIESITGNISTLQGAYESLMSGDFTYEDFLELVQQFPELAEGVDASSDSFEGLAKNLRKAIKNAPDDLVDELKDLREQLVKAGKSTDAIDQLIDSMENLPSDKIDELSQKYVTLADVIDDANQAQGELAKAMGENPNSNYENTSEAVQKMREMYANGAFGSESEIWDIFEALTGTTYDFTKSLTENKNVLKDWINTYSGFYLGEDDGEYAHKPIEKFLNFMEGKIQNAKKKGEEWASAVTWTYEDGAINVDYDNQYLDELAKAAGLTEAAFQDLMMQVAQFFAMKWEDADDIVWYMEEISKQAEESGANADETLKKLAEAMNYFNKGDVDLTSRPEVPFDTENFGSWKEYYQTIVDNAKEAEEYRKWAQEEIDAINSGEYTATVYSNTFSKSELLGLEEGESDSAIVVTPILPDGTVLSPEELKGYARKLLSGEEIDIDGINLGIFEGKNAIDDANEFAYKLHEAQEIYYDALERFSADNIIAQINEGGIDVLDQISELSSSISNGVSGEVFIDTTSLISTLTEAQYTEDAIAEVISKLHELEGVTLYDEDSDPFGLYKATDSAEEMVTALEKAGIAIEKSFASDGGANSYLYHIDVREMSEVLASRGWTTNDIVNYINSATGTYTDGTVFADMSINVDTTDIDEALGKADQLPEDAKTEYTIDISPTFKAINDEWDKLTKEKKVDYIVNKKTIFSFGWGSDNGAGVNGTAHYKGTAFASGNWGAPRTETALTGELGRELVVRGNRWFTIGDSGAEFTRIKKGDIIFNHKQTEELLSNGYITSRGQAYASGTAYSTSSGVNIFSQNASDINYKGDLSDSVKGAADSTSDAADDAKEAIDFIEIKLEEIETIISKTAAKLENYADDASSAVLKNKDSAYNTLVNAEKDKAATYFAAATIYNKKAASLLQDIPSQYRSMAQNGAIAIADFVGESNTEIAEAINTYREWATKADDAETGYLEAIAQQAAYRVEQIEDIADDFDNIVNFINTKSTLLQAHMDTMEESGERIGENMYKALIESTKQQKVELEKERKELQAHLNAAVTSGEITKYSDEWYQLVGLINEVDESIIQCDTDIKGFYNSIKEVRFEALDKLVSRFEAIDSELSHLYDRFTDDDQFVDDAGNWTDEGIAAMGVLAQQMEVAQTQSEQYAKAIDDLKKNWKTLGLSEDEYNEKLAELTESQWDSIEAYEDAKDAIVDLNKTRIDAVKEGMEKEIDAYKELIDLKKESLDADKDAHDFEKEVAEQEKDISDIERKIAALRGDNSASAAAQRKQLEAELLEAKAQLEETYYDRSVEKQKEALDDEYERYEKNMNDEMEALDKYLEDSEKVIHDSMNTVKNNANTVLKEINSISKKYGIDITNSITSPWRDGSNAITGYQDSFTKLASSFAQELDKIIEREKALQRAAENAANSVIGSVNGTLSGTTGANNPKPAGGTKVTYIDPNGKTQIGYAINGKTYTKDIEDDKYRVPVGSIVTDKAGRQWLMTANGGVLYTGGSTSGSTSSGNPGYVSSIQATLQKGQSGPSVKRVQEILNKLGFNCGTADGIFGEKTYKAVQAFQRDTRWGGKIAVDGIVGAATKKKFKLAGYAKGTTGVKNDQFAWIDEIGEELVLHAGNDGKLSYLTKGTGVVPADLTSKLMDLALDPTQTLDASRPVINAPHIVNNEINIDMNFGSVVNIEHVDNDTIPDLTKAVEKQMDKYMKNLNNQIRKYSR